jgi:uncharacterized protein (UPF0548 family)
VTLGHGQTVFAHARSLLRAWTPFAQPWLALFGAETPPTPGQVVVLHARHFGLQSLNVCRVVYVHDEPRGFAFAYGTLALHAARGEERFAVRWHDDDRVSFRITAFSRPNGVLIWLGYPVMRVLQRRFARTAGQIMRAAVENRA